MQIRVRWVNTIRANSYYGYQQCFNANAGGVQSSDQQIASASEFGSQKNYERSASNYTEWLTVPVSATQTSVHVVAWWWDNSSKKRNGAIEGDIVIPGY